MKLKFLSNPNWIIIFYLSVTVTKIIVILVPLVETPCEQTCLRLCTFLTIFSFSWDIHRIFFETFLFPQKIAPILAPSPLNFNNKNFQELCTIKKYKKCNLENYMYLGCSIMHQLVWNFPLSVLKEYLQGTRLAEFQFSICLCELYHARNANFHSLSKVIWNKWAPWRRTLKIRCHYFAINRRMIK